MRGDLPRKEANGLPTDAKAAGFDSLNGSHMPCGLFAFFWCPSPARHEIPPVFYRPI